MHEHIINAAGGGTVSNKFMTVEKSHFKNHDKILNSSDLYDKDAIKKEVWFYRDCFYEGMKVFLNELVKKNIDLKPFWSDPFWGHGKEDFDETGYIGQVGGHPIITSIYEEITFGDPRPVSERQTWLSVKMEARKTC